MQNITEMGSAANRSLAGVQSSPDVVAQNDDTSGDMSLMLMSACVLHQKTLTDRIGSKIKQQEGADQELKTYTLAENALRSARPDGTDTTKMTGGRVGFSDASGVWYDNVTDYYKTRGIVVTPNGEGKLSQAQVDGMISSLGASASTLNTGSQLSMLSIEGMTKACDLMMSMVTDLMNKDDAQKQKIVSR